MPTSELTRAQVQEWRAEAENARTATGAAAYFAENAVALCDALLARMGDATSPGDGWDSVQAWKARAAAAEARATRAEEALRELVDAFDAEPKVGPFVALMNARRVLGEVSPS